jgi:hypothetical protein
MRLILEILALSPFVRWALRADRGELLEGAGSALLACLGLFVLHHLGL